MQEKKSWLNPWLSTWDRFAQGIRRDPEPAEFWAEFWLLNKVERSDYNSDVMRDGSFSFPRYKQMNRELDT